MQSEDFDKKIRDAAEHHHPAYDEKAWVNMEKLLDKHLPQQQERKRRFLFLLLFLLLIGAGTWLALTKPWKQHEPISKNEKQLPGEKNNDNSKSLSASADKNVPTVESIKDNTINKAEENESIQENSNTLKLNTPENEIVMMTDNKKPTVDKKNNGQEGVVAFEVINAGARNKSNKKQKKEASLSEEAETRGTALSKASKNESGGNDNIGGNIVNSDQQKNDEKNDQEMEEIREQLPVKAVIEETKKETIVTADNKKEDKKRDKKQSKSHLFLSLSAAPDISSVGNDKLGKVKLLAGVGVGYTFKDRLTIRTGFYTGRKVYTATAENYHPPFDLNVYYPYLVNIDADCKVYEIPLLVSYNFGKSAKHSWFASAGLSSFLMKSEEYTYNYKTNPTSPVYHQSWTIVDENKHYFSVATISAGYKRDINKKFFVMAEPYVKLPLGGVGFGKVKLNSAGALFTIGIKPFK